MTRPVCLVIVRVVVIFCNFVGPECAVVLINVAGPSSSKMAKGEVDLSLAQLPLA